MEPVERAEAAFEAQKWVHDAGVEIYFYPVPDLPIIDASIILDAGSARDPDGKEGLSELAATLLSAGTATLDEDEFAEQLAFTGADIDANVDRDKMIISIRTLSDTKPRKRAFELFRMMVREPVFPKDILEREVKRLVLGLKQSLTEPGPVVRRGFKSALFADHPYGKLITEDSLVSITQANVADLYTENFVRKRMKFAFVGDISREEINAMVDSLLDGLKAGTPASPIPDRNETPGGVTRRIKHPSVQSHIVIGALGLKRGDPDYFKLHLGAETLGGGMTSRLFREVREERGLAYSVSSHFNPTGARGEFVMSAQTSNEQADRTRQVMIDTLRRFIEEGPTEEELDRAKETWKKGFALRLDSNRKIMGYMEVIAHYGLPLNYPAYAASEIGRISAKDVQTAFRERISLDRLVEVVVGS